MADGDHDFHGVSSDPRKDISNKLDIDRNRERMIFSFYLLLTRLSCRLMHSSDQVASGRPFQRTITYDNLPTFLPSTSNEQNAEYIRARCTVSKSQHRGESVKSDPKSPYSIPSPGTVGLGHELSSPNLGLAPSCLLSRFGASNTSPPTILVQSAPGWLPGWLSLGS